jgi:RES domain
LSLPFVSPQGPIYRIARKPDPWSPPDWSRAHDDGTFGNRFDDSKGYFRVVYAGSSPLTCFLETLSRYRVAPASRLEQELEEISDAPSDYIPPGTVPGSWLTERKIGRALPAGKRFADIYSSQWIAHLRRQFEPMLIEQGVIKSGDVDSIFRS